MTKNERIDIRMSDEDIRSLDKLAEILNTSRSESVRAAVNRMLKTDCEHEWVNGRLCNNCGKFDRRYDLDG